MNEPGSISLNSIINDSAILIVEDSPTQATALGYLLETNGYRVTKAVNGKDAMRLLKIMKPHLIISDINMPEMNGYEMCKTLKSEPAYKNIPVILLTSMSEPTDIINGIQSGADSFITKPYENEYLLTRIENIIVNRQLRKSINSDVPIEIIFRGNKYSINAEREQILDLLISVFETAIDKNDKLLDIQASQIQMIDEITIKNNELVKTRDELRGLTEDLEKQKKYLMRSKETIRAIISSIADGILVTDVNQKIIMMNRAAEEFLGITFSEIENCTFDTIIGDDSIKKEISHIINQLKHEYDFDFSINSGGKTPDRIMHGKTALITDSEGKRQGTVTVISDVTSEREIDRMKTEFLSTAAHELRTPLTSIQGFSEILLTRNNLTDEARERYLTYINKQALKLANIVNDLLDISRIESGQGFTVTSQVYDIKQSIEDIIPHFSSITSGHEININIPDQNVICYADKDKIEQVIKNLLSNAIKYSPGGGDIDITGKQSGDYYEISISDHGMGMTPEQVGNVFKKFYRVDSSDSAPEGTGLGMTIVKYLVEAHGGTVKLESEYGKGTTVIFTVPLHHIEIQQHQ